LDDQFADQLEAILKGAGGGRCPVSMVYLQARNRARIDCGDRWHVVPSDELLLALREQLGAERVALEY
jgi:DNA polymerase-3 subunit alpha